MLKRHTQDFLMLVVLSIAALVGWLSDSMMCRCEGTPCDMCNSRLFWSCYGAKGQTPTNDPTNMLFNKELLTAFHYFKQKIKNSC
jgi:hypothetical protein